MKKFLLLILTLFCFTLWGKDFVDYTKSLITFEEVADYVKKNKKLPDNYITKKEAKKLGWNPNKGNLWKVAPGKSIGGDRYQNREKLLPNKKGRVWYEADIQYKGGKRGKYRLLFSNDGLIYKTENHYQSFKRMF